MTKPDLLTHLRTHKLAVLSTTGPAGAPSAALVGVAVSDALELIFDTLSTTRKHANMLRDPRVAVTFSGPGEQTVQIEGVASAVSVTAEHDAEYRDIYYAAWPDGRARLGWEGLAYWRVTPTWARYTNYAQSPVAVEFLWGPSRNG
jgi:general stress protein 26